MFLRVYYCVYNAFFRSISHEPWLLLLLLLFIQLKKIDDIPPKTLRIITPFVKKS